MDSCCRCKKKFSSKLNLYECPSCGGGIIGTDDDNFLDFISEYDSNGF